MSSPDLKKRHMQCTNPSTMEQVTNSPKVAARTVTWDEIPEWQRDNKNIVRGYRPGKANYVEVLTSLTFLHNETCNVYTHLIGALLLPLIAAGLMQFLSEPQFSSVSATDYAMFGIFFWSAECCLIFSTTYHLFMSHSHEVEQFWLRMDLLGIVIVTVGTFIPGIYYAFTCEPNLQILHWTIITVSGSATAVLICVPRFRRWRTARTCAYIALGASSFIPMLHGVQLYGLQYMLQYSGMKWYLLELAFYGSGVGMYAFRSPERFAPGRFDIWGSSHQIFHLAILCAMYIHVIALTQAFTACHTLDLCEIQASLREN